MTRPIDPLIQRGNMQLGMWLEMDLSHMVMAHSLRWRCNPHLEVVTMCLSIPVVFSHCCGKTLNTSKVNKEGLVWALSLGVPSVMVGRHGGKHMKQQVTLLLQLGRARWMLVLSSLSVIQPP